MSYIDDSMKQTEIFEDRIGWMYLDTVGLVTCGVGQQLPTAPIAAALPWLVWNSVAAGRTAILSDWYRVKALPAGKGASYYKGNLDLPNDAIDSLLRSKIFAVDKQLAIDFPAYATFSDSRKLALIDMSYNLGESRLMREYPIFDAAVRAGDWDKAIANCLRDAKVKAFDARNEWTQRMLAVAA